MRNNNVFRLCSKAVFLLFVALLSWANIAIAQAPTATLVGQVVDSSKAAVVGATVLIRNTATNQTRTALTGVQGEYTISDLPPAIFDVTVTMTGFRPLQQTNLELQADQTARLDATLEVGSQVETVSVTTDVGLLNTETSSEGDVVTPVEVAEMPLNGRDFNDLAFTVAGVQPAEQGGKGASYVANGSRADSSAIYIDGINDESPRDAGSQISPPLDSILEFKMETSGFTAQYGRLSGSVVNMVPCTEDSVMVSSSVPTTHLPDHKIPNPAPTRRVGRVLCQPGCAESTRRIWLVGLRHSPQLHGQYCLPDRFQILSTAGLAGERQHQGLQRPAVHSQGVGHSGSWPGDASQPNLQWSYRQPEQGRVV